MAGKGSPKGVKQGGRKPGTPNKLTADLKSMILGALDAVGGQTYLQDQANKSPAAFMTLIGKVLPTTIAGDPNASPVQHVMKVTLVRPTRRD